MAPATESPSPTANPTPFSNPVATAHLEAREAPPAALLRVHALDPARTRARCADHGIELPADTGGRAGPDPVALCLRPGEWLMISRSRSAADLARALEPGLVGQVATCLDVSAGHRLLHLTGRAAPWLLSKLGGLDYLAGASGAAHATRTRLAHIPVILGYDPAVPDGPRFDLVVDRSLAEYLWARLADAAPHAEELFETHGVPA